MADLSLEGKYALIEREAGPSTLRVQEAVLASHNEAEFRSRIYGHIEELAARLGVELTPREEYTLTSGRALIPENLVEDFGAQNERAHRAARAFYHALEGHADDLVGKLFDQWQLFFSVVKTLNESFGNKRAGNPVGNGPVWRDFPSH